MLIQQHLPCFLQTVSNSRCCKALLERKLEGVRSVTSNLTQADLKPLPLPYFLQPVSESRCCDALLERKLEGVRLVTSNSLQQI
jgi:hypothetical protein